MSASSSLGREKEHLGTLLVKAGIITKDELETALVESEARNKRLGEILLERGSATEEQIQNFLSIQLGYPVVKLEHTYIDREVVSMIPEKFSRRHGLLPLYRADTPEKEVIVVAMTDPANIVAQDEVKNALGTDIFVALASQTEMNVFLEKIWGPNPEAAASEKTTPASILPDADELKPALARILSMLFNRCLELGASAMHFEPKKKFVAVRYKIDGDYQTVTSLPRDTYSSVLSRIKILSKIELAESLIGVVEGRFHIRPDLSKPPIDVRVTLVPAVFGEKAVLKFTRHGEIIRPLTDLGFEPDQHRAVTELLRQESGLFLIGGKNDSGKTTLSYSLLSHLETSSKMVVTIEDPPSYPVSSYNQIARTDSSGRMKLSWEDALRAVERQEPHIVYLPGVDTLDEAKVMLRMASTGRFVIATLFADDATSAYWVPFQLGADPYAVASVLQGVVFSRLLRRLCDQCRREAPATAEHAAALGMNDLKGKTFFEAPGCDACRGTGSIGRVGVYEVLVVHDHLREMIKTRNLSTTFRQAAIESGMMTLKTAALAKAARGQVSLAEVAARVR